MSRGTYYTPGPSPWPIVGSVSLFFMALGAIGLVRGSGWGYLPFIAGSLGLAWMMYGWFANVIDEDARGLYNDQVDRSFRWGMAWFIFSEVMFFGAFFGTLFYARVLAVPWLGGAGAEDMTQAILWPNFMAQWPLLDLPDATRYTPAKEAMEAWGIPALNTVILLTSGATVTWAHWGARNGDRTQLVRGLAATVGLGTIFVGMQAWEYYHAYTAMDLRLTSGIYGSTFFMLTGFHGAHVTIGAIMLAAILGRALKGHFTPENHFGFEAAAWYWHFVDVIWLCLFVFVYFL